MSVKKQAVSLLTGLAMLLTLLMLRPVPVSASDGLPSLLSVGEYVLVDEQNPDFSDNNQYFVWEIDDWKEYESLPDGVSSYFQYEKGVLTLSNVKIEGNTNNPCGAGINVEGGSLEIVSIGTNLVTGVAASNGNTYAAVVTGDNTEIVFAGNGTLTATAAGEASKPSIGINAYNITMESGTVTANGATGSESFGISVRGTLTVSGGTLTANGGPSGTANGGPSGNESFGIHAPDMNVTGGTVNATGKDAATASFGIATDGDLEISGGKVVAKAGQASEVTKGVDVRNYQGENGEQFGKLIVSGGILDATGGTATGAPGDSYGVYAPVVTVSAGTVYATGVKSANASYGIATAGDLVVTGSGNVIAQAGTAGCDSQAIDVRWYEVGDQKGNPGKLEVSGGALTANGGQAGVTSCGVKANGEFVVSNGTLTANGGPFGNESFGIQAPSMNVTGGTVNANGQNAQNNSFGISVADGLVITDGKVTAISGEAGSASLGIDVSGRWDNHGNLLDAGDMVVSGGQVIAEGANASVESYGIKTTGDLTVTAGTVSAEGAEATGKDSRSCGVVTDGVLAVENGTVTATGGLSGNVSCGVVATDMLQVSGGNVIAEGGGTAENPAEASVGIVSESLAVSGGNVQATTGDATNTSMGISSSFVNVSRNGIVSVTAGNGKEFSVGIGVAGFQISDNALVISKAGVGQESYGILSDNATMNNGTLITDTIGISHFSGDKETNCLVYGQDSYLEGNVVLPVDIEIPEGVEILIEEGNSLTVSKGVTLTNNGSINGTGIIYNNGTIKTGENGSYTVKIVVPEVPQKEYTIYFDGNGGNVSVSSMTTTGGKLVSMPYATRYGYTFTGWYTASGTQVSAGTVFTADTTLYAGWKSDVIYVPVEPEVPDYTPVKPSQPSEPSEPKTEWRREDGNIYYYKDGKMVKGWVEEDGVWYWMDEETGAMTTEDWVKVENVWYAFDDAGKMLTGWQEIDGEWYYLKDWGGMATGWQFIDNNWYYFRGNGTMVASAWVETNGQWYFLTGSGAMASDKWIEWKGEWYFLYSSGMMATNATIDGYYVDSNGIWRA